MIFPLAAGMLACGGAALAAITFSGSFDTTSASSPVASATLTAAGAGTLRFESVFSDGSAPAYSKNGGAWTTITEGMTLAIADGDTLAVRAALPVVGTQASFNIVNDATLALIEGVTLTRV